MPVIVALGLFVLFVGLKTDQNIRQRADPRPALGLAGDLRRHRRGRPFRLTVAFVRPYLAAQKAAKAQARRSKPKPASSRRNFSHDRDRLP